MTLCLAQSLIDRKGAFVPQDQIRKYLDWYQNGYYSSTGRCFDLGSTTRKALTQWLTYFGENPEMDRESPDAHLPGQKIIDAALGQKVRALMQSIRSTAQTELTTPHR